MKHFRVLAIAYALATAVTAASELPAQAQNQKLQTTASATGDSSQSTGGTERRLALVIGNNGYRDGALTAPINDARGMTAALTGLGFKVVKLEDGSRLAMLKAIRGFIDELKNSDAVGLFYFAGHGVQSKGKNFLIPIDADIENEDDIELQSVDLQYLLDKFADMRNGMNILILDSCRNNPFAQRGVRANAGLAAIDGPPGTLVAFAAAPGQVAREMPGSNGIYTKNVLANISQPGLPVEEVFKRVRTGVLADTNDFQVPLHILALLRTDFALGCAERS